MLLLDLLLALATTPAAPAPAPALNDALVESARLCTGYGQGGELKLRYHTEQFMNLPPAVAAKVKSKSLSDAPQLVQNYLRTAPSARAARPFVVMLMPSTGGNVWIAPGQDGLCDVMVTDADDVAGSVAALSASMTAQGWQTLKRVEATERLPLGQQLLLKATPLPDDPHFGTSAKLQWVAGSLASKDGLQLEINFTSGTIKR